MFSTLFCAYVLKCFINNISVVWSDLEKELLLLINLEKVMMPFTFSTPPFSTKKESSVKNN